MALQSSAKTILFVTIGIILTVFPAVIQGRYMNRWGASPDATDAAAQLQRFPEQIGQWRMVSETNDLPESVLRELQLAGYWDRTYTNQTNGDVVAVLMMVGLPGALSRHPPEICFASRANERIGAAKQVTVVDEEETPHEFRLLHFKRTDGLESRFSVCYGFTVEGTWSRPRNPRIQFGGASLLYKMQVVSEVQTDGDELPAVTTQFLSEFLPAFRENCIRK